MNSDNAIKAQTLVEALPYIQKYSGQTVVIKFGGSAMKDENVKRSVMQDVVLLCQIGVKVVLVHGGGPEINAALKRAGIVPEFVNGLRKTDKETMEIVQMVLAGKVGKDLVGLINSFGGRAIGLCGLDGGMLRVKPVDPELGYVGEVIAVDERVLVRQLENGMIPVVSTIGGDRDGNAYNVNADNAAASIAGALNALALINMTDAPGLLADVKDESSLIPAVKVSDVPEMIKNGTISGGMLPKVQSAIDALRLGAKNVFIIDGRTPHAIIMEMLTNEGMGTMFC